MSCWRCRAISKRAMTRHFIRQTKFSRFMLFVFNAYFWLPSVGSHFKEKAVVFHGSYSCFSAHYTGKDGKYFWSRRHLVNFKNLIIYADKSLTFLNANFPFCVILKCTLFI